MNKPSLLPLALCLGIGADLAMETARAETPTEAPYTIRAYEDTPGAIPRAGELVQGLDAWGSNPVAAKAAASMAAVTAASKIRDLNGCRGASSSRVHPLAVPGAIEAMTIQNLVNCLAVSVPLPVSVSRDLLKTKLESALASRAIGQSTEAHILMVEPNVADAFILNLPKPNDLSDTGYVTIWASCQEGLAKSRVTKDGAECASDSFPVGPYCYPNNLAQCSTTYGDKEGYLVPFQY